MMVIMNQATATTEQVSSYTRRQRALAASPVGLLAAKMTAGTRWLTPSGVTVTVWKGWSPDVVGEAESVARRYKWGMPDTNHNTELGVSSSDRGVERVSVDAVGDWLPA